MTQKDNILQELQELKSSLVKHTAQNVYTVPDGYFDGLATQMLKRIKAMEAATASEELFYLSPVVNNLSKQVPFAIPAGYFEALASQTLNRIKALESVTAAEELQHLSPLLSRLSKEAPYTLPAGYFEELPLENIAASNNELSAKEELETISPLLSGLKKEMPYHVPQGYFESLAADTPIAENKPASKVVSLGSRKWFRYAAAAVVVGVIATIAFIKLGQKENPEGQSLAKYEKTLNKEIKKMSDKELDDFLQYTDAGLDGSENVKVNPDEEIKELLKDVTEDELKEFLEETSDAEPDSETSMMN